MVEVIPVLNLVVRTWHQTKTFWFTQHTPKK